MKGFSLSTNQSNRQLIASVDPLLFDGVMKDAPIVELIKSSEYKGFYLLANAISSLCQKVNAAKLEESMNPISMTIGEVRDANITIQIADDHMSATLTLEAPHSGSVPSVDNCIALLKQQGVTRGISKKRIQSLLNDANTAEPGNEFKSEVAMGMPARKGKSSYVKALVPNALERILQPQAEHGGKVDMRDLGAILCVQAKQAVAKRQAPTQGRNGYSVSGKVLFAEKGEWKDFKIGLNTVISPIDENLILATVSGQPKFENEVMNVDDTFETKGVNVGTGNIDYDGAVVVSGDVTESMQVIAKGDITISGFVESATIRSGGDIIITEGAMGKMNEEDCRLYAKGSIFVQHGQGLDIIAGKNVNIMKQLAYSRVKCKGTVTVGDPAKPMGNIFASDIKCYWTVRAGTVGAISGSTLNVDFSEGINLLNDRYDILLGLLKSLRANNFDHEVKLRDIHAKHIPGSLISQLQKVDGVFESEKFLLQWLERAEQEMKQAKVEYERNAKIVANKELFPGVVVKMNKHTWRSERDYERCVIRLADGKWIYDPLV